VTYNSSADYTFRKRFIVAAERGYFAIDWLFFKDPGRRHRDCKPTGWA